jgi:hypothetical protein
MAMEGTVTNRPHHPNGEHVVESSKRYVIGKYNLFAALTALGNDCYWAFPGKYFGSAK